LLVIINIALNSLLSSNVITEIKRTTITNPRNLDYLDTPENSGTILAVQLYIIPKNSGTIITNPRNEYHQSKECLSPIQGMQNQP